MDDELQSFKLPQLRARCKELGLKGYSKLSKPLLIELINGSASGGEVPPAKRPRVGPLKTPSAVITEAMDNAVAPPAPPEIVPPTLHIAMRVHSPEQQPLAHGPHPQTTPRPAPAHTAVTATKQLTATEISTAPSQIKAKRPAISRVQLIQKLKPLPTPHSPQPQQGGSDRDSLDQQHTKQQQAEYLARSFIYDQAVDPSILGTEGFAVALRFCMSRFASEGVVPRVSSCEKVSKDVWKLKVETAKVHVLAETGESLGSTLRDDWVAWTKQGRDLASAIRTKNLHDFPGGLCPSLQTERRDIARRAVFSSCAGESFSGPKLAVAQMDSEWLGRPSDGLPSVAGVQLYLPEAKQIVSVHTSSLHPALAIVHRSSGVSDFVLRETGQVVGDEQQVCEVWQEVLGCNASGNA